MKRRDIWLIVIVVVVALGIYVATPQGRSQLSALFAAATPAPEVTPEPTEPPVTTATPEPTEPPTADATPEPTEPPVATATPEPTASAEAPAATPRPTFSSMILSPTAAPRPTLRPAESYVRVSAGGYIRAILPLLEDTTYPVTQAGGRENILHIDKNSVSMESSTCDNQDCVHQGVVTLENKDMRVLYNMIVCLPNQVQLELLTPEEAQVAYEEMIG